MLDLPLCLGVFRGVRVLRYADGLQYSLDARGGVGGSLVPYQYFWRAVHGAPFFASPRVAEEIEHVLLGFPRRLVVFDGNRSAVVVRQDVAPYPKLYLFELLQLVFVKLLFPH